MAAVELYPFHRSNIHERRTAAALVRAVPLIFITVFSAFVFYGVFRYPIVLLVLCAVTNVTIWLWMSSLAVVGILGSVAALCEIDEVEATRAAQAFDPTKAPAALQAAVAGVPDQAPGAEASLAPPTRTIVPADIEEQRLEDNVVHLIVFPNYKEAEEMLVETLESLGQCDGASNFHVVLAMEAREGEQGTLKGQRLQRQFANVFARVMVTSHPANLVELHNDGSRDQEVPGKASNLKWAVKEAHKEMTSSGNINLEDVVLTVSDADCLFHPSYFNYVGRDFSTLRKLTGSEQLWSMWQAPQLPFRNYYDSPVPSRAWGYVASFYEFGGVSSLLCGGHHMVFSSYSLSLVLAAAADPWDGDVLAEDHHAYLKCVFYSAWASKDKTASRNPLVKVRPVLLPVKSTSVVSDRGYWQTWVERWHQAKRHAQGVAELSYALLATWDALVHLPLSAYNWDLVSRIWLLHQRLFCVHLLPMAQFVAMTVMSVYWMWNDRKVPMCPDRIWVWPLVPHQLLCGFAGAWALTWPVVIPMVLIIIANVLFLWVFFVRPVTTSGLRSRWHLEDAQIQPTLGSKLLTVIIQTAFDCAICLGPLMFPYGLGVQVLAYGTLLRWGNRVEYITAAKASALACATNGPCYGSINDSTAVGGELKKGSAAVMACAPATGPSPAAAI